MNVMIHGKVHTPVFLLLAFFAVLGQWTPPVDTVQMIFGGDVMLGRNVGEHLAASDADYPWRYISRYLTDADIAVVNIECVVGTLRRHIAKEYIFQAVPEALSGLAKAGIDAVSLANNHIYDYFGDGVLSTVENIRNVGIVPLGAGANAEEYFAPQSFWIRGNWVVLLGLNDTRAGFWGEENPGCAPTWTAWGESVAVAKVEAMNAMGATVIAIEHYGREYDLFPLERQIEISHRLIDAGAVAVIGSHSHRLQGVEFYAGGVIVYSLGNLVFDQQDSLGNIGALFELSLVDGKIVRTRMLPTETLSHFAQPHPFQSDLVRELMLRLCRPFNTVVQKEGDWLIFQ